MLLKIYCDYDRKEGRVEVMQTDRPILVRVVPVRNSATLADGDTIRIDAGQVLRCNFSERLLEEERNIIRSLEVHDLVCRFRNRQVAIDGISFSVQRGEMVCVMGASGSGKSTLMRALSGQFPPAQGDVLFNGRNTTPSTSISPSRRTWISQPPCAPPTSRAATACAASTANSPNSVSTRGAVTSSARPTRKRSQVAKENA